MSKLDNDAQVWAQAVCQADRNGLKLAPDLAETYQKLIEAARGAAVLVLQFSARNDGPGLHHLNTCRKHFMAYEANPAVQPFRELESEVIRAHELIKGDKLPMYGGTAYPSGHHATMAFVDAVFNACILAVDDIMGLAKRDDGCVEATQAEARIRGRMQAVEPFNARELLPLMAREAVKVHDLRNGTPAVQNAAGTVCPAADPTAPREATAWLHHLFTWYSILGTTVTIAAAPATWYCMHRQYGWWFFGLR